MFYSTSELQKLKLIQQEIADNVYNLEYEFEEEIEEAELIYKSILNVLSEAYGDSIKCSEIDPLLFLRYKEKFDKPNINITRTQCNIALGLCH